MPELILELEGDITNAQIVEVSTGDTPTTGGTGIMRDIIKFIVHLSIGWFAEYAKKTDSGLFAKIDDIAADLLARNEEAIVDFIMNKLASQNITTENLQEKVKEAMVEFITKG